MRTARLGVIGGSGLYQMDGLTQIEEVTLTTQFGAPSDVMTLGMLGGTPIAFLPRHGRGHRLSPTEVPALANIAALKSLGVEWILSVSAVGSLREEYAPLHLVLPDQLIDRTKSRPNSFFSGGMVAHVGFADPFCPATCDRLEAALRELGDIPYHRGGTYVCIEGPQFSTKAESRLYRQWGCDIIGMTALPEAKLAREAEICYATIACVTDYDVWHASEEAVSLEMVTANLTRNAANAQRIIRAVAAQLPAGRSAATCGCDHALANAIITDPAHMTPELHEKYELLLGKYL
ncbi:MAG: S-methyl-5'-thioadenosine phosphorylase [Ktedonobacterales bacterium]